MEQLDRRVRRTRKSLGDALIALTLEKAYEEITIQELTDRADIGYRTFFRHYSDKDGLLKDVLSKTMMELRELMAPPPPELFIDPNFKAADFLDSLILFQHVQKHSDLYRVLLDSDRTIIQSVVDFAMKEIQTTFKRLNGLDVPTDIIANHLVSTTFGMVRWWLEADMPYSPEEMGAYAFNLIVYPIREMILQALRK